MIVFVVLMITAFVVAAAVFICWVVLEVLHGIAGRAFIQELNRYARESRTWIDTPDVGAALSAEVIRRSDNSILG